MEWNCLSIHKLQMGQRCFSTRLSSATIITQYPVFHCNSIRIVYFFLGPLQNRPCIVFSFSLNKLLNGQSNRWWFETSCLTVISGGGGGGGIEKEEDISIALCQLQKQNEIYICNVANENTKESPQIWRTGDMWGTKKHLRCNSHESDETS